MNRPQRREGTSVLPPDPDPRFVDEDDVWDPSVAAWVPRRSGLPALLTGLVLGGLIGFVLAAAVVHAAPRSAAQLVIPAAAPSAHADGPRGVSTDAAASGNLAEQPTGAPPTIAVSPSASPTPAGRPSAAPRQTPRPTRRPSPRSVVRGDASYVAAGYGSRYLALPGGPGIRVRICGDDGCVDRTSTDAGPDLAMQRAGRIADLSIDDFASVCGCRPELVGVIPVRVEYLG